MSMSVEITDERNDHFPERVNDSFLCFVSNLCSYFILSNIYFYTIFNYISCLF